MRQLFARVGIGGVALALATTALAVPASAATRPQLSLTASGARHDVPSSYLAGWQKNNVRSIIIASVKFTLPALDCSDVADGTYAGSAFGVGDEATESAGTMFATAFAYCSGTTPGYEVEVIAPDGSGNFGDTDAAAGDAMTATITQSGGQTTADVFDATTNEDVTVSGTTGSDTTVTYGAFPLFTGGTDPLPAPDFGVVHLPRTTLNGAPLTMYHPQRLTEFASSDAITAGNIGPRGGFRLVYHAVS